MKHWQPAGTAYGCLLNFQREWDLWSPRMAQDPYKGPPRAPVLYVKSANTFNPGGTLMLQDGVNEVDIGATLGLVIGAHGAPDSAVLLNDWSVPHQSYFRPPVKFRCRDGFLGCGSPPVPWAPMDLASLSINVQLNGQRVQTVRLSELVRPVERLLADVGEFMSLQAGDVLMLGTDVLANGQRPRARAGDTVCLSAPGFAPLIQTVQSEAA
ncbi:fumarylacetoacetate hydrolase family protein [Limnohabitans sp. Bal53]|uniref:fumarylacetoacetate hydrolase family protein n=1 Tax=Limnohabitans sp. Bal53 TaxID=1977910 RepID=UPI000D3593D6|nr:fumarylacetoacetate hydrolase family protein [Limnohabitans sp. Bal53]PUE40577.1 fumarylacetoacetate hydrolase [Limnohabitans sp. Bal53]